MTNTKNTPGGVPNQTQPQDLVPDSIEKKMLLEAEKVALQLERDEINQVSQLAGVVSSGRQSSSTRSHLETLTEMVNLLDEQQQLAREITEHTRHLLRVNKKLYCQPGDGTLKKVKNPQQEAERQLSSGVNVLKGISYNLQIAGSSAVNIGSKIVEISRELKDERIRLLEKKRQMDDLRGQLETNLDYFDPRQEKLSREPLVEDDDDDNDVEGIISSVQGMSDYLDNLNDETQDAIIHRECVKTDTPVEDYQLDTTKTSTNK